MFASIFQKNNKVQNISTCVSKIKVIYNKGNCYVCQSKDYLKPLISDYTVCFCQNCNVKVLMYEYIDLIAYNDLIDLHLNLKKNENEIKKEKLESFLYSDDI